MDDTLNATNEAQDVEDDYQYDLNGNMISDQNKHITSITYNHLNLPKVVTFEGSNKSIEYLYDATGVKLRKSVTKPNTANNTVENAVTEYFGGFQYTSVAAASGVELQFFPHPEGYVKNTVIESQNRYNYVYNYTDHLGNIRLSYTFDEHSGTVQPIDEHHYYPPDSYRDGLELINIDNTAKMDYKKEVYTYVEPSTGKNVTITKPLIVQVANSGYQYQFQEQEFQDELGLNWYSFKYRNYDPAIARFFNVDPLSEKYSYQSHYNFSENRVIDGRELEGLEYISVHHYANNTYDMTKYYQMTNKYILEMEGTPADNNNSVAYGPLGKGILHLYYNQDGKVVNSNWEQHQIGGKSDLMYHGLYSGPGCITYDGINSSENYNFDLQPIDWADAIAKRHDADYAYATKLGDKYAGYLEDIRTLQADKDMVDRVDKLYLAFLNPFKSNEVEGVQKPFRTTYSTELSSTLLGQRTLINALAVYKQWKIDNNLGNDNLYKDNREVFSKEHPTITLILDQLQ